MKADLFLHATSLESAKSIIVHGFNASLGKEIWNVSCGKNYFLSVKKTAKENGVESVRKEFASILDNAFQQGEPSAVVHNSKRRVVFLLDLAGLKYGEDTSCSYPNAVETEENVSPKRIIKIWVDRHDITAALPYWRHCFGTRDLFNSDSIEVTNPWEAAVQDHFGKVDYIEFPSGEYEEISAVKLKKLK